MTDELPKTIDELVERLSTTEKGRIIIWNNGISPRIQTIGTPERVIKAFNRMSQHFHTSVYAPCLVRANIPQDFIDQAKGVSLSVYNTLLREQGDIVYGNKLASDYYAALELFLNARRDKNFILQMTAMLTLSVVSVNNRLLQFEITYLNRNHAQIIKPEYIHKHIYGRNWRELNL